MTNNLGSLGGSLRDVGPRQKPKCAHLLKGGGIVMRLVHIAPAVRSTTFYYLRRHVLAASCAQANAPCGSRSFGDRDASKQVGAIAASRTL